MDIELGKGKSARRTYGFDEIALAPSIITINPDDVDISVLIAGRKLKVPIIASAMDSVVSPTTASLMSKLWALGVLNLQGVWTRYEDAGSVLEQISKAAPHEYVPLMQKIYLEPVKKELIVKRIKEIKKGGGIVAVSSIPQMAKEFGTLATEAGAEIFVLQSTVISTKHRSKTSQPLDLPQFCADIKIPVILGNCATYEVALDLVATGIAALLVGIGPGAACTTRGVLGVGVPMATTIADCAQARDVYFKESGKYIPIIADGGMVVGGDICKAIACGADAVMIGSPLAKAEEAPGKGYHWGMATPNALLPRGARVKVGTIGKLEEIIHGPAKFDDGSMNFSGALKTSMGTLGAANIKEMQKVEVVIAPSISTEGKVFQKAQQLGMYK
jgi:IMP dehydrogenase